MDFIGFDDNDFEHQDKSKKRKQGRAINRKTKVNLVFDRDARMKFLTGFRKRKQERKVQYEEKLHKELAEEKKKMREEASKSIKNKQSSSHSILPEVEHLLADEDDSEGEEEPMETYDLGSTVVSISSLDDSVHRNQHLMKIKEEDDDDDGIKKEEEGGFLTYKRPIQDISLADSANVKRNKIKPLLAKAAQAKEETLIRKETTKLLMQTDAYKKALRFKQKKSKKFKNNRLQPGARGGKKGIEAAAAAAAEAKKSGAAGAKGGGKGGGKKKAPKSKAK